MRSKFAERECSNLFETRSLYFSNLSSLLHWYQRGYLSENDQLNIPRETLENYRISRTKLSQRRENERPIVTVCHDFKGGYQSGEDLDPLGDFEHISGRHYWLRYVELVDEFIYFSHHMVTIPPTGWTNYLHRNGIPVLGTLIFEGSRNGYSDNEIFKKNEGGDFVYVKILTYLCQVFHFEGWLVNFETRFDPKSEAAVEFVRSLTTSISMNINHGRVVWYDSYVPQLNRVLYQNEINELNWSFFTAANRFMTNYWWDFDNLQHTLMNAGKLGIRNKVSFGIDVWGRGMKIGNGGLTSGIAVEYAKKFDGNVTLFAPAWTYEHFSLEQFFEIDDQFWLKIKKSIGADPYEGHFDTTPWFVGRDSLSFLTFFSSGEGQFFKVNGLEVSNRKWVQIGMATPMPLKSELLDVDYTDSYIGGSSLKLSISQFESGVITLYKFQHYLEACLVGGYKLKARVCFKNLVRNVIPKLQLKCFIIRRGRKSGQVIKVQGLTVEVPLKFTKDDSWDEAESSIDIPRLSSSLREEILVESVDIAWSVDTFSKTELGDESWYMVPEEVEDQATDDNLFLGLLSLEIFKPVAQIPQHNNKVWKVNNNIIEWQDNDYSFMWLVLKNDVLNSVTFTHFYPLSIAREEFKKVKVLQLERSGKILDLGYVKQINNI